MLAKKLGKNLLVNRKKTHFVQSATYRIILRITFFILCVCLPEKLHLLKFFP